MTALAQHPAKLSAEDGLTVQTTDRLIRDTHALLSRAGIPAGRSKVSRVVRAWSGPLAVTPAFVDYLARRLAMTTRQRAAVSEEHRRVVGYADPTGESAVRNVMRGA